MGKRHRSTLAAVACLWIALVAIACADRPAHKTGSGSDVPAADENTAPSEEKTKPPALKKASVDGFSVGMSFHDCLALSKKLALEPREDYAFGTIRGVGNMMGHKVLIQMNFQDGLPHGRLVKLVAEYTDLHDKSSLAKSTLFAEAQKHLGKPGEITENPEGDPRVDHENATWNFDDAKIQVRKEVSWPKGQPNPSWEYRLIMENTTPLGPPPKPMPTAHEQKAIKFSQELAARAMMHIEELMKETPANLQPSPGKCLADLRTSNIQLMGPAAECMLKSKTMDDVDKCLDACRK